MSKAEATTGFLGRWSARKRQQEIAPEQVDTPPAPAALPEASADPESAPPITLTDADMPALESLHAGSDVSMFFAQGVSQALRQQALRRLFHQPEFNVRCPLDEYAEDYSQPEKLLATQARELKSWAQQRAQAWRDEWQQAAAEAEQPDAAAPRPETVAGHEAVEAVTAPEMTETPEMAGTRSELVEESVQDRRSPS
ncbi:DUF3306 domain-containing protein [Marinospirillum sp. MEB164]|uniref:DUF3306 domain-containing protein n=1 Tax=Marinospirillum alkalitolerans TaxID=3123374 RepID=A0ABW8PZC1_9GAMM